MDTLVQLERARPRLPEFLRRGTTHFESLTDLKRDLRRLKLHTVCESARCPNIHECFHRGAATFMILGNLCTRGCTFCSVPKFNPRRQDSPLDPDEPKNVARMAAEMNLRYVVITSVNRDDLADGGSRHFAETVRAVKLALPNAQVEVLTPDFDGNLDAVATVLDAAPDVFNHNMETVPGNYLTVRPGARYFHSVRLLQRVKELDPTMFTKSGIMVGLGEERHEVLQVMDDLRSAEVDFLTIGQYLQPTRKHHPVVRFVPPDEFKGYATTAAAKGFLLVSATPLTRSSHHAGEDFARLKAARIARLSVTAKQS